jgi:prepilin peptidase CpaA
MNTIETIGLSAGMVLILAAAWQDFRNWKIPNATVAAAVAAWGVLALGRWAAEPAGVLADLAPSPLPGELAGGAVLFVAGFLLWAFKLLGAGDAKLMLPVGLFVGMAHLPLFALVLFVGGVVVMLLLRFPVPLQFQAWQPMLRIEEIRRTRKVPYGVLIALATVVALYARYWGAA